MEERIRNDKGAKWRISEVGHGETGFPIFPFSNLHFVFKGDVNPDNPGNTYDLAGKACERGRLGRLGRLRGDASPKK